MCVCVCVCVLSRNVSFSPTFQRLSNIYIYVWMDGSPIGLPQAWADFTYLVSLCVCMYVCMDLQIDWHVHGLASHILSLCVCERMYGCMYGSGQRPGPTPHISSLCVCIYMYVRTYVFTCVCMCVA